MTSTTVKEVTPIKEVRPDVRLMRVTNQRVAANNAAGSNAHSGWLSDIRAGITPAGELRAVTRAGQYIADLNPSNHSAAIRSAAIRAINRDVANTYSTSLGRSLALLSIKEGGSSVEDQIAVLPLLTVDGAALLFDGLIGRCARHGIPINFEQLAKTLIYWGSGAGARSVSQRTQVVLDFYLGANHSKSDG